MSAKKVAIEVTATDIRNGKQKSCVRCPIALAARRTLGIPRVWVDDANLDDGERAFSLPESAREFIIRFDHGKSVKPFRFTLRATP